jgi:uncharacterized LabA/DUF88 family protein
LRIAAEETKTARQIAVFWDLDNIYWGLSNFYGANANTEEMIMQIIDKIWDFYKDDKVRMFSAYADFERVPKIQSELQRKRVTSKHVFGTKHRDETVRYSGDIELSLDALETLIKCPDIDCYVIISANKDIIPLMNRVKYYGRSVHLFFLEAFMAADRSLLDYADQAISLEFLLGLEPVKTASINIESLVLQAVAIVNRFYMRNAEKPKMYLGKEFFVTEAMTILNVDRQNAQDLLEFCLDKGYLSTAQTIDKHEKIVVPPALERVVFAAVAQITANGKSM